jgi:hypothetical protein
MKVISKLSKFELSLIELVKNTCKNYEYSIISKIMFDRYFKSLVNKGIIRIKQINEDKYYLIA